MDNEDATSPKIQCTKAVNTAPPEVSERQTDALELNDDFKTGKAIKINHYLIPKSSSLNHKIPLQHHKQVKLIHNKSSIKRRRLE